MSKVQHLDDPDEISQLPDCILHHILSFVSTKDAVQTSILSKRWINLWVGVSNLDFDDALLYASDMDSRDFMDFVDKVLLLRDPSNIQKFRLSCRVCFNPTRICSWISAAIAHNVKYLNLCLFAEDPFVLPQPMFSCGSLTSLKLGMNCVLEIPTRVLLPGLKMLHLSLVVFFDDESTQRLFAGCPVLDELVMFDCEWGNLKKITISSSTLTSLTIDDLPCFGPPGPPEPTGGCRIVIDTPNLKYMKYTGYPSNKIFLRHTSAPVKAYVSIPLPHEQRKPVAWRVHSLLKRFQDVVSLTVSNRTIESLVCTGDMLVYFPLFRHFTTLEFNMHTGSRMVEALEKFFKCCPNLKNLHFKKGFDHDVRFDEKEQIWSYITSSMPSRIKTYKFSNFPGYNFEICCMKCVLKNDIISEKVNISMGDLNRREQVIRKEVSMIASDCTSCVVTFW